MTDTFNMRVAGLEHVTAQGTQGPKIVTDELALAGREMGLAVEQKAKGYAPVWRGPLRRSITSRTSPFGTTVTPLFVTTKVGTNSKYGAEKEFGRDPASPMPPPGALLPWMAAKGIAATPLSIKGTRRVRNDKGEVIGSIISGQGFVGPRRYLPIEYLIARSIKRNAPKPRPYLGKAFNELKPQIRARYAKVPERVIARLKAL